MIVRIMVPAFLIIVSFAFCAYAQTEELAIVANSQGAPSEMAVFDMKTVFKGERQRWKDGTKIVVALMKTTTPVGSTTAKRIYKMSGNDLNKYWLALVFQGKAKTPKFFNSEDDLKSFVAQTSGAIGAINAAAVGDGNFILIDGKKVF